VGVRSEDTHVHGTVFARREAMDGIPQRQMISKVPVFALLDLDGKTLTMSAKQGVDREHGVITTVLYGEDEYGRVYVLACVEERC
jgi:hypothetical protein